jgi:hypothetical protein
MIFEVLENAGIDFESLSDDELQVVANEAYEILDELSKKELDEGDKDDKFISDKTYNKVSDHVSAKHPGHKLHGLGRGPNGTINWRAYHKDDNNFKKPISGVFKESVELDERMMTDAEMKKREDIVKGMKKGMAGFKERYGDRAKNVMYATANKNAMKD